MTGLFGKKSKDQTSNVRQRKKELRKFVKEKQYDKALRAGDEILKKVPHENDVLFIIGGIHYMRGKYKTAISFFEKSLEIGSYDVDVLLLKANSHFRLGQNTDCISCCDKIKELDPKNKGVKELLAKIEHKKG